MHIYYTFLMYAYCSCMYVSQYVCTCMYVCIHVSIINTNTNTVLYRSLLDSGKERWTFSRPLIGGPDSSELAPWSCDSNVVSLPPIRGPELGADLIFRSILFIYFWCAAQQHSAGSLHTDAQRWNIAGALELELVKRRCADRLKGLRCLKALLATEPQSN